MLALSRHEASHSHSPRLNASGLDWLGIDVLSDSRQDQSRGRASSTFQGRRANRASTGASCGWSSSATRCGCGGGRVAKQSKAERTSSLLPSVDATQPRAESVISIKRNLLANYAESDLTGDVEDQALQCHRRQRTTGDNLAQSELYVAHVRSDVFTEASLTFHISNSSLDVEAAEDDTACRERRTKNAQDVFGSEGDDGVVLS